jgi:IS30 family transposase
MDTMENTTKIITAWELYQQNIPNTHIAKHLGKHRETIGIWIENIKHLGLDKFLNEYEQAKKKERKARQLDPIWKFRIWGIRERESDCCGQKIQYFLYQEYGVKIAVSKIYEVLAEKYKLRSKWKHNQKRGAVPKASRPREVVQMDTVDFGDIFAFTGVDIFTRDADVMIAPALTSKYGLSYLEQSMQRRFEHHVELIQTDGGHEFKDEFKRKVNKYCKVHRIARAYKKNEQSYIESFNRTLRKECLGWKKYRQKEIENCVRMVEKFLNRYHNHRPHMGLGMMTPINFKAGLSDF